MSRVPGNKYKRGDQVNYDPLVKPNKDEIFFERGTALQANRMLEYKSVNGTYVWAIMDHWGTKYVIEHVDGMDKSFFMASKGFEDGLESVHSSKLQDGKKYIYADEAQLTLCTK